jgi:hypothetical protein
LDGGRSHGGVFDTISMFHRPILYRASWLGFDGQALGIFLGGYRCEDDPGGFVCRHVTFNNRFILTQARAWQSMGIVR